MGFFVFCHVSVGLISGSAYKVKRILDGHGSIGDLPTFNMGRPIHGFLIVFALISPWIVIITSFVNEGIWGLATIVEICVGIFVVQKMGPTTNILYITSPFTLSIIYGALWGFWFIG